MIHQFKLNSLEEINQERKVLHLFSEFHQKEVKKWHNYWLLKSDVKTYNYEF